jgi:hypothetical protein
MTAWVGHQNQIELVSPLLLEHLALTDSAKLDAEDSE